MSIPEIRAEAWEGDEQVIVVSGLGVVGKTLSKRDAVIVTRWLRTARELFAANERAQVAEAMCEWLAAELTDFWRDRGYTGPDAMAVAREALRSKGSDTASE